MLGRGHFAVLGWPCDVTMFGVASEGSRDTGSGRRQRWTLGVGVCCAECLPFPSGAISQSGKHRHRTPHWRRLRQCLLGAGLFNGACTHPRVWPFSQRQTNLTGPGAACLRLCIYPRPDRPPAQNAQGDFSPSHSFQGSQRRRWKLNQFLIQFQETQPRDFLGAYERPAVLLGLRLYMRKGEK